MRTAFSVLTALLALLIAATPVAAHHGRGSHGRGPDLDDGPNGAKSEKHGGFATCDWRSDPGGCPGNSGWAHWCKDQFGPGSARGQCIAEHARGQGVEVDRDAEVQRGNLKITGIGVGEGGAFGVHGRGAEGSVVVWVGGGSGQVVGFGQGEADAGGNFEIVGLWSCRDDDAPHEARIHIQDRDEQDSDPATFPCHQED